jgi:hypothetical protein
LLLKGGLNVITRKLILQSAFSRQASRLREKILGDITMNKRSILSVVLVVFVLTMTPLSSTVWAKNAVNEKAILFQGAPSYPGAPCDGTGADQGNPAGFVNAHLNIKQGKIIVNVHLKNGLPDQEYNVYVRCYAILGTLTTDQFGVGNATFSISANIPPQTFAIDMQTIPQGLDYLSTSPITLP